jgi:hypothetical protein
MREAAETAQASFLLPDLIVDQQHGFFMKFSFIFRVAFLRATHPARTMAAAIIAAISLKFKVQSSKSSIRPLHFFQPQFGAIWCNFRWLVAPMSPGQPRRPQAGKGGARCKTLKNRRVSGFGLRAPSLPPVKINAELSGIIMEINDLRKAFVGNQRLMHSALCINGLRQMCFPI